jgi:hypothetical protein
MQKRIGFFGVLFIMAAVHASDYFPAKIGKKWEFDYQYFSGHGAGGETDSGIVTWTITAISQKGNVKEITIKQERKLRRKSYKVYTVSYDSIFSSPRELQPEVVKFIDSGNVLYRPQEQGGMSSMQVLVHDPNGKIPSGICVHDTTILVNKYQRAAKLVTTGSCDLSTDHVPYDYFFQCDSIGPVEYHYDWRGTMIFTGAYTAEHWTLHNSPVNIKKETVYMNGISYGNNKPRSALSLNAFTSTTFYDNLLFDLNGRCVTGMKTTRNIPVSKGVFIIIPGNLQKNSFQ